MLGRLVCHHPGTAATRPRSARSGIIWALVLAALMVTLAMAAV